MSNPKVSILIPTHEFLNSDFYLTRLLNSIRSQSFQDYEILVENDGTGMAHKLNKLMQVAQGDLIKVLFTDDYLRDSNSLRRLVDGHRGNWSVTGCIHDDGWIFNDQSNLFNPHFPRWHQDMPFGNNTIGSPSVLMLKNSKSLPKWDANLSWLTDCDYYQKLYDNFGEPAIIEEIDIVIGLHDSQETNVLSDKKKQKELEYMVKKYGKN